VLLQLQAKALNVHVGGLGEGARGRDASTLLYDCAATCVCADPYQRRLNTLPAPHLFGRFWPEFQLAEDPLFKMLRPVTAKVDVISQSITACNVRRYMLICHCDGLQGTGAALMHPAFARFLDRWASESWDSPTCTITWKIIQQMSESYLSKAMQGCAILARCHMCHGCGNVLVSCAWLQTLMTRPP
jgi:hypothetical protein